MSRVRPKKHLGQHFLTDMTIADRIVDATFPAAEGKKVLEIGPGTGVLTERLVQRDIDLTVFEVDDESVEYLKVQLLTSKIEYKGDFLKEDLTPFGQEIHLIGNLPYNISSQIFFQMLQFKDIAKTGVFMIQKEVAERIASPPGSKKYGILSVLLQAYYDIDYLFTVGEHVFNPPPKVKSGVIRLVRNEVERLDCDEKLFKRVVKQGFNNRRKTLRNALKPLDLTQSIREIELLNQRAEQLSVAEFIGLTKLISESNDT